MRTRLSFSLTTQDPEELRHRIGMRGLSAIYYHRRMMMEIRHRNALGEITQAEGRTKTIQDLIDLDLYIRTHL